MDTVAAHPEQGQAENGAATHQLRFEPSSKRVRVMANGKTVADSLCTILLAETGAMPVCYFPAADIRMDFLEASEHRYRCPYKGEAMFWSLKTGGSRIEDAVWSYRDASSAASRIKDLYAFDWDKVDHWFEEDEEIFAHPRDPRHRVDVRPSSREIRASFAGETIALSRHALFLFETDLPTRYYIPRRDIRFDLLTPTRRHTTCPYKGEASYWSITVGDRVAKDAVWAYPDPLPDCPRIKDHFCFYPEKLDQFEVEGETGRS